MKKRVICIFSLILYLLLACGVLSVKIEGEMTTQAKVVKRQNRGESFSINPSVLFSDEEGEYLYDVIEGTGWDSGLRARELPSESWYMDAYGSVKFDGSAQAYRFIYSASRQPRDGEKIFTVEKFEKGKDQYLYLYPEGIPEAWELPGNAEIIARTERALLLDMTDAEFPFFRHTAETLNDSTKLSEDVFSLMEVAQFLEALPGVLTVFLFLTGGVIFWSLACGCSFRADENKLLVGGNGLLAAASLGCMAFSLRSIELPASMLPTDNIFDWQYYREELYTVLNTLNDLGVTDLQCVKDRILDQCLVYIRYIILAVLIIAALELLMKRVMKRENRQEG